MKQIERTLRLRDTRRELSKVIFEILQEPEEEEQCKNL